MQFEIDLAPDEALALPDELAACIRGGKWILTLQPRSEFEDEVFRDHSAFLNGYAPEDEGLYDDVPTR